MNPLGMGGFQGGLPPQPENSTALMGQIASLMGQIQQGGGMPGIPPPPPPPVGDYTEEEPVTLGELKGEEAKLVKEVVVRNSAKLQTDKARPETNAVYIVLKASSHDMLHLSVQTGLWAVSPEIEETLNEAYNTHSCVVLAFAVRESRHFIGYAFMATQIKPRHEQPASVQADFTNLPSEWSNPFRVSWVRIGSVPFASVEHVVNVHDQGRSVTQAADGQLLTTIAGSQICNAIDASSVDIAKKSTVTRHAHPKKKLRLNVAGLSYEQYVTLILTKRKQRLKAAVKNQRALGVPLFNPAPAPVPPLQQSQASQLNQLLGSGNNINVLMELLNKNQ